MAPHRIQDTVAPASGRHPTDEVRIRSRERLPHWERDEAAYFVTFRLSSRIRVATLVVDAFAALRWSAVSTQCMVRHAEPRPCGLLLDAGEDADTTLIQDRQIMEKLHGKRG
jgi:hypothetical protein